MDDLEMDAISACALRFDGYKYADDFHLFIETDFETTIPVFDGFADNPDFDADTNFLHAMLFFFQRFWLREGWLKDASYGMKIVRLLFLKLCAEEIEARYRFGDWHEKWQNKYSPNLPEIIELIEHNHRKTEYRSESSWRLERR